MGNLERTCLQPTPIVPPSQPFVTAPPHTAHDLIDMANNVGVCSNRLIPAVPGEWRKPRHEEFAPRNVWNLFNAFTESLKQGSPAELPKRTEALHRLLDAHSGLATRPVQN